ncbi:MAG: LPXTG cell wall anchor domain-containing protein, partial [Promethearchaeota archaeon]
STKNLSGNYTIFAIAYYENSNTQYKGVKVFIQRPTKEANGQGGPGFDYISAILGIATLLGISIFLSKRRRN